MKQATLHLCNAQIINAIEVYLPLVGKQDAIVFFATDMSPQQLQHLIMQAQEKRSYWLVDNNPQQLNSINYAKLAELINHYDKTFTWK